MPSPTTKTLPSTSSSHGDKPEWWLRQETWNEFCASSDYARHRSLLIDEAEWSFGLVIAEYPHVVAMSSYLDLGEFCNFIDKASTWLKDQNIDCIAFDTNAVGKYKELSNAVLFRNADDAMLFKLTWK